MAGEEERQIRQERVEEALRPGVVLGSQFEIVSRLPQDEQGRMSVLFEGKDRSNHDRKVAIKVVFADDQATRAQTLERLRDEAEKTANLPPAYFVHVYGQGIDPGGDFAWFAMEYLTGKTLHRVIEQRRQLLRRQETSAGPIGSSDLSGSTAEPAGAANDMALVLPWEEARSIAAIVLRALRHLHGIGLTHRDLKPANVMLTAEDQWKVLDLGITRRCSVLTGKVSDELLPGSPLYMAPEIWTEGKYSAQSDFYALGIMLIEMLTGEPPIPLRSTLAQCRQAHREGDLAQNLRQMGQLPKEAVAIVERAIAKNPDHRHANATDFLAELLGAATPPAPKKHRVVLGVAVVAAGIAVVLSIPLLLFAGGRVWFAFLPADPAPQNEMPRGESPRPTASSVVDAFNVLVWSPQKEGLPIGAKGALPIHNREQLTLEVKLNQPACIYLLWLDSEGNLSPLYPWNRGCVLDVKDLKGPIPLVEPSLLAESPAVLKGERPRGWEMEGPKGFEALLLLVRRTPLPADAPLEATIGTAVKRPLDNREELVVLGLDQDQRIPQFNQKRRPSAQAKVIDSEALQLCYRLQQTFQLEAVRWIGFAHEE
jgi:hypothetical protein